MITRRLVVASRQTVRNFLRWPFQNWKKNDIKKKDDWEDTTTTTDEECDSDQPPICDETCDKEPADCIPPPIPPTFDLVRAEFPGKVRFGFIPDEWFQFFYPKTGVTGPYTFGVGLITYLLSKEIYVLEHEYYTGLSFALLLILAIKKYGPPTAVYLDKEIDNIEKSWQDMHKTDIENLEKQIEAERKEQWRAEGALMLIEAKRLMIDMQLETAYREKIMEVYRDIVNRLEYQIACTNVERRLTHKQMMFWIHNEVLKSISAEKDEKLMEKTKADLSAMAIRLKDLERDEEIRQNSKFQTPQSST